ncbi:LAGLIDADG family homing endonuclease [Candidatus Woesearchaeota archaeon]|nr:LAGLIDADG family homing endonuclease [Candidatus Woesearchaeota archaeon]
MIVDKEYRITLPKKSFEKYQTNDFIRVSIRKNSNDAYFYLRTPTKQPSRKYRQVRRKIPREIIKKFNLKEGDTIKLVELKKVNKQRIKSFRKDYFDLLSLELKDLMVDTFLKNGEKWVRFWSSSKYGGSAKPIELKRYIPINRKLGEFFGLMQAESRKYGYHFDFTNILIKEHKIFLEVAEILGIDRKRWKFGLIYNPQLSKEDINSSIKNFSNELTIKCGYMTKSKTITKVAYSSYISSKILNHVMNSILKKLRKDLVSYIMHNEYAKEFYRGFIIKYILGDGTITLHKNDNGASIVLSEGDYQSRIDFMNILKLFNINSTSYSIKITISTDLNSILFFMENDLFDGHYKNRKKLLSSFISNYYIKTFFDRLNEIKEPTSIRKFSIANKIPYNTSNMALHRYKKRGFLNSFKEKNKTLYHLTPKAEKYLDVVSKAKEDLTTLSRCP